MKSHTSRRSASRPKSSITLPPNELATVLHLMKDLKLKSKVEVVRRGLELLKEATDREKIREEFARAAPALRASWEKEREDLEDLASDVIDRL